MSQSYYWTNYKPMITQMLDLLGKGRVGAY